MAWGGGDFTRQSRNSSMELSQPSTSMKTPLVSFCTNPDKESFLARLKMKGRNPTPWISPLTEICVLFSIKRINI